MTSVQGAAHHEVAEIRERAVQALCDPQYADIVDLVVWVEDQIAYAANSVGRVRWTEAGREVVSGDDPIGSEDPMAFLPYTEELANPSPARSTDNAYPYPRVRLLSFFSDPERSPDLAIVHTPQHDFRDQGGHLGEHGSLDLIQSRAPWVLSGLGVRREGFVDDHARLVDVGPTLAHLAGVPLEHLVDLDGNPLDGSPRLDYFDNTEPRRVIGILWDGGASGEVLCGAEEGWLPNVARLIERGLAFRGGAIAEFPSITLTNHTAILTGVGPGRHGVMGNVYYDRVKQEQVVPNDQSTWHRSAEWLHDSVKTIFEMVNDYAEAPGPVRTASIDEAIDRGADYSTMGLMRETGESTTDALDDFLPPVDSPYRTSDEFEWDGWFTWSQRVDDLGLQQILDLWADPAQAPRLTWWSNIVSDAGHHEGGPRSAQGREGLIQSDRRLGVFLDHLEQAGVLDEVTILLTADHGFEAADPSVTGSWQGALDSLGVPYREEGPNPGLVYFGIEGGRCFGDDASTRHSADD